MNRLRRGITASLAISSVTNVSPTRLPSRLSRATLLCDPLAASGRLLFGSRARRSRRFQDVDRTQDGSHHVRSVCHSRGSRRGNRIRCAAAACVAAFETPPARVVDSLFRSLARSENASDRRLTFESSVITGAAKKIGASRGWRPGPADRCTSHPHFRLTRRALPHERANAP
jgi:hypothetical protein